MWHTVLDDMVSVRQRYEYVIKLNEYHITHELHVFEQRHHSLSLVNAMSASKEKNINQNVNQWVSLALSWKNRYILWTKCKIGQYKKQAGTFYYCLFLYMMDV